MCNKVPRKMKSIYVTQCSFTTLQSYKSLSHVLIVMLVVINQVRLYELQCLQILGHQVEIYGTICICAPL